MSQKVHLYKLAPRFYRSAIFQQLTYNMMLKKAPKKGFPRPEWVNTGGDGGEGATLINMSF